MDSGEKARQVCALLAEHYPNITKCFLDYHAPYELLIATILSAQCTDDRVNLVTKDLFARYASVDAFADAELSDMEAAVKSTGFYHNKAKNIILSMRKLRDEYGYELPSDIGQLCQFPGVGRKTANVLRGHVFGEDSVVVDTHVKRLSRKLGLTKNADPEKIEYDLMAVLPKSEWIAYNTRIITHGRAVCTARSPKCGGCFLAELCESRG